MNTGTASVAGIWGQDEFSHHWSALQLLSQPALPSAGTDTNRAWRRRWRLHRGRALRLAPAPRRRVRARRFECERRENDRVVRGNFRIDIVQMGGKGERTESARSAVERCEASRHFARC
eukprot:scaffold241_cov242-Pinguiococcus_pyrenoidosus.AAC.29